MRTAGRRIPVALPRFRYRREADNGRARVAADDDLLLLLDAKGRLRGLDAESGNPLWVREMSLVTDASGEDRSVGVPGFAEDGTILVPIVTPDASLSVHGLSRDGRPLFVTRVGPSVPPQADPRPGGQVNGFRVVEGGRWMASWIREPAESEEWVAVRAPDGSVWDRAETGVGCLEGVVTTSTLENDGGIILRGRDVRDGRERWSVRINSSGSSLTAELIAGGGLLLVNRAGEGVVRLIALSPTDGSVRWQREFEGDLISILTAPHIHAAVIARRDGRGSIVRLDKESGAIVCQGEIGSLSPASPRWPPATDEWPRVLVADHTHLLWSTGAELIAERLADPGAIAWRMPLPGGNDLEYGPDLSGAPAIPSTSLTVAGNLLFFRVESSVIECWA